MEKILLVAHHDQDLLGRLGNEFRGWNVKAVDDSNGVVNLVQRFKDSVAAVVIDLDLPKQDGLAVLRKMRRIDPAVPIVALTETGDSPNSGSAAATAWAPKPVDRDGLVRTLHRVTSSRGAGSRKSLNAEGRQSDSLWLGPAMRSVHRSLEALGDWDVPVIFLGETGVGKEVAARELHRLSSRAAKPLVKINCAALPSELLESELFGYEKGAFTGAVGAKPGKFELADGGTIVLDEIGDMDLGLQAKLLHVLQDGEFDRIGGKKSVRVDVRVLAATHRDLESAIAEGSFRQDLYYRLNVASVTIPPLRKRKDEVISLTQRFLEKYSAPKGVEAPEIPTHLGEALLDYDWPGNVRELENVARRFLVFRQPDDIIAELRKRCPERRQATASQLLAVAGGTVSSNGSAEGGTPQASLQIVGSKAPSEARGEHGRGEGFSQGRSPDYHATTSEYGHAAGALTSGNLPKGGESVGRVAPLSESAPPDSIQQAIDPIVEQVLRSSWREERPLQGQDSSNDRPSRSQPDPWSNKHEDGFTDRRDELREESSTRRNEGPTNGAVRPAEDVRACLDPLESEGQFSTTLPQVAALTREVERRTIIAALNRSTWNRKKAARLLEIDYKGLLYKIKKLEIVEVYNDSSRASSQSNGTSNQSADQPRR